MNQACSAISLLIRTDSGRATFTALFCLQMFAFWSALNYTIEIEIHTALNLIKRVGRKEFASSYQNADPD